jgi:hypothetical protein
VQVVAPADIQGGHGLSSAHVILIELRIEFEAGAVYPVWLDRW